MLGTKAIETCDERHTSLRSCVQEHKLKNGMRIELPRKSAVHSPKLNANTDPDEAMLDYCCILHMLATAADSGAEDCSSLFSNPVALQVQRRSLHAFLNSP